MRQYMLGKMFTSVRNINNYFKYMFVSYKMI